MDLCLEDERCPGESISKSWWEHVSMYLAGSHLADTRALDKRAKEEAEEEYGSDNKIGMVH